MKRMRIPALVDMIEVDDPAAIATLADDPRLDRQYASRGPFLNRLVLRRLRLALTLDGKPMPSVTPRGVRPAPAQAALEARLAPIAASLNQDDPSVHALAGYVRGEGPESAVGALAQDAVGRLFAPGFKADDKTWAAAKTIEEALRTFNPILLFWWGLTGKLEKARRELASRVGGDPSGVHGLAVTVHNFVPAFMAMRALWADPEARSKLTPEQAMARCIVAPRQVVRQPTEAGSSPAGDFTDSTLIVFKLRDADALAPSPETEFMTANWARCPAYAWVPALIAAVWRAAQAGGPSGN